MATSNDDRISSTKLATFATKLWTKLKSTFAAVSHIHAASDITSGTFADERIASASTWNAKQDALTFDTAPAEESTNPVTSGGVYTALELKQDAIDHRGRLYDIDIAGNATTASTATSAASADVATDYAQVGAIATALGNRAMDSEVVHIADAETVTGTKTFTNNVTVQKSSWPCVLVKQTTSGTMAKLTVDGSGKVRLAETDADNNDTQIVQYSSSQYCFRGNADSATKLGTDAGSATTPVYFSSGKPVACSGASLVAASYGSVYFLTAYQAMTFSDGSTTVSTTTAVKGSSTDYASVNYYSSASATTKSGTVQVLKSLKVSRTGYVGILSGIFVPYPNTYYVRDDSNGLKFSACSAVTVAIPSDWGLTNAFGYGSCTFTGNYMIWAGVSGNVVSFAANSTFANFTKGEGYRFHIPLQFSTSV